MQSLKDKLLKAGLVSQADAQRIDAEKAKEKAKEPARPSRPSGERRGGPNEGRGGGFGGRRDESRTPVSLDRVPKFAPLPGSAAYSREQSRKQLELDRKLRELVLLHEVSIDDGASAFYFATRKNKLKRLLLTEPQAEKIRNGELAIVERPDPDRINYALVPPACAKELLALSERSVRFFKSADSPVGFLSDEEIHRRANEATEPETDDAPSTAAEGAAAGEASAPTEGEPAVKEPETFITVKRAPLAGDGTPQGQ